MSAFYNLSEAMVQAACVSNGLDAELVDARAERTRGGGVWLSVTVGDTHETRELENGYCLLDFSFTESAALAFAREVAQREVCG